MQGPQLPPKLWSQVSNIAAVSHISIDLKLMLVKLGPHIDILPFVFELWCPYTSPFIGFNKSRELSLGIKLSSGFGQVSLWLGSFSGQCLFEQFEFSLPRHGFRNKPLK